MVTVTVKVNACESCPHFDPCGSVGFCTKSEGIGQMYLPEPDKVHPRCPFLKKDDAS